jgi:hypothetical protein
LGIASFKTLMYVPFISTLSNTVSATLQASNRSGADEVNVNNDSFGYPSSI